MKKTFYSLFLFSFLLPFLSCQQTNGEFVCKPCNLPCDTLTFSAAGTCPHCHMPLVSVESLKADQGLKINEADIHEGSGAFLIEGGKGKEEKTIKVFYHQPLNYQADSKILMVIPGAGRNGDSYRDAWIEASEKYNVLILSPMYEEESYSFEDYHLGGLIYETNLRNSVEYVENSNQVILDESRFTFQIREEKDQWIFQDFDRIFDAVVAAKGSSQTTYDLFGHSAGGQILHRLAIFHPENKANRILASNSGFYTLPNFDFPLPFGLKSSTLANEDLGPIFSKKLVLFIGELDNETETGGTLLRSPSADHQGLHRLERAKFFFEQSQQKATALKTDFQWEIEIIPQVGHNHRNMGQAAAKYLYE